MFAKILQKHASHKHIDFSKMEISNVQIDPAFSSTCCSGFSGPYQPLPLLVGGFSQPIRKYMRKSNWIIFLKFEE